MKIIDIRNPLFIKKYNNKQLQFLCADMRTFIIDAVCKNGGHLSSNLGSMESIVAMHYVFNYKKDFFYFDIGHQAYPHKILTGRAKLFNHLRHEGGAEAFLKKYESPYDIYEGGRSSTAPAAALGHALARKIQNENFEVLTYIGDGAFQNGIQFEFMNNLYLFKTKVIIILNDNGMSISLDVGTIRLRLAEREQKMKYTYKYADLDIEKLLHGPNDPDNIFSLYKIAYLGPIDGHNIKHMIQALEYAKSSKHSIMLHIKTIKGKGLSYAENDTLGTYHGVPPGFNKQTGEFPVLDLFKKSRITCDALKKEMASNEKIIACTPGMGAPSYTNLLDIKNTYPDRIYDLGINEELQALMGLGLRNGKLLPFLDYYSAFITRAYDQIIQDITRARSSAVFTMHDAGFATASGDTHHTLYDIGIFTSLPNTIIANPFTIQEIYDVVHTSLQTISTQNVAFFIRGSEVKIKKPDDYETFQGSNIVIGKWKIYHEAKKPEAYIISYDYNLAYLEQCIADAGLNITIINAIFIKPLDIAMLKKVINTGKKIFVYEDVYVSCGLGAYILSKLNQLDLDSSNFKVFGSEKKYYHMGTLESLKKHAGIDGNTIIKQIKEIIKN